MKLKINTGAHSPQYQSNLKKSPVVVSDGVLMNEFSNLPANSPPVILREWSRDEDEQNNKTHEDETADSTPSSSSTLLREWSNDEEDTSAATPTSNNNDDKSAAITPASSTKNEPFWVSAIFPSVEQVSKTTNSPSSSDNGKKGKDGDDEGKEDDGDAPETEGALATGTVLQKVKKAGVSVVGGAMVGVGLVMIPLPTPCGVVVAGSGLAVLGTEYPAAQKVLEGARDTLVDAIENNIIEKDDDEGEKRPLSDTDSKKSDNDDEYEMIPSATPATGRNSPDNSSSDLDDNSTTTTTTKIIENIEYKPSLTQLRDEILLSSNPEECKEKTSILLGEIGSRIKRNASNIGKKVVPVLKSIGTNNTESASAVAVMETSPPPPSTEGTTIVNPDETATATDNNDRIISSTPIEI